MDESFLYYENRSDFLLGKFYNQIFKVEYGFDKST